MKYFKNIPKYISSSHYYVNVMWFGLERQLEHYQDSEKEIMNLNLCPDFQRGHVWTKQQQTLYIEYKLSGGYGADQIYTNCNGWMNSFAGPFELVDGLQRITAVRKFLNNKIKAFGSYFNDYGDKQYLSSIDFVWHVNNLKTRKEVLRWYLELNNSGTPHTREELQRVKKLLSAENRS